MGILDGKKIVITGVLTDASLAFGVARIALAEGADIVAVSGDPLTDVTEAITCGATAAAYRAAKAPWL